MDNNEQIFEFYTYCKETQQLQIKRKFINQELIGAGNEGFVFLAKPIDWCFKVDQVAIKIQKGYNQKIFEFYQKLSEQQIKLDQNKSDEKSYIVKIYEICLSQQKDLVIIMEIGGQDLYKYQKQNKELDFKRKEQICLQLALAIKQLHELQYIHRDIKPENFVMVNNEFKLIDFGLTKQIEQTEMTMNVGSRIFQAPEILQGDGHYTSSVDIWSLGCTFYEVFANQELLQVKTNLEAQILICEHIKNQKYIYDKIEGLNISQQWKSLIKKMFNHLPNDRISSSEIVFTIQSFLNIQNNIFTNNQIPFDKRFQTPQPQIGFPQSQQAIPQTFNINPQLQNGCTQNMNKGLNIINGQNNNFPFQGSNQQIQNKQNENQQNFNQKQFNNTFSKQQNFQAAKPQVGQNNPGNFCLMTQQEQTSQQKVTFNPNQNVLNTQSFQNFLNNQQINVNKDQKFQVQEQIHQQFNQKVQKLESELQDAKNEITKLQNENNKLQNEKQQLLDENNKMKDFLLRQKQQQQNSFEVLNQFLNQDQQYQS